MRVKTAMLATVAVILASAFVCHAGENDVKANLTARKVVKAADGKEVFVSADQAKPGELIEYTAVYENVTSSDVKDFFATLPVPDGMEYVPGTAKPVKVLASLDGRKFDLVPLKRTVRLASGKDAVREVPYREYRTLRWDLRKLAAGAKATVSARMKITTPDDRKK